MHHGTCVTHVPWCMSGSLTCSDGENVPGIPGACAPAILRIWQEAHTWVSFVNICEKIDHVVTAPRCTLPMARYLCVTVLAKEMYLVIFKFAFILHSRVLVSDVTDMKCLLRRLCYLLIYVIYVYNLIYVFVNIMTYFFLCLYKFDYDIWIVVFVACRLGDLVPRVTYECGKLLAFSIIHMCSAFIFISYKNVIFIKLLFLIILFTKHFT